jgi:hypothetical protein
VICPAPVFAISMRAPSKEDDRGLGRHGNGDRAGVGVLAEPAVRGERQAIAGAGLDRPGAPSRDQRRDNLGDVLRRERAQLGLDRVGDLRRRYLPGSNRAAEM